MAHHLHVWSQFVYIILIVYLMHWFAFTELFYLTGGLRTLKIIFLFAPSNAVVDLRAFCTVAALTFALVWSLVTLLSVCFWIYFCTYIPNLKSYSFISWCLLDHALIKEQPTCTQWVWVQFLLWLIQVIHGISKGSCQKLLLYSRNISLYSLHRGMPKPLNGACMTLDVCVRVSYFGRLHWLILFIWQNFIRTCCNSPQRFSLRDLA